LAEGIASSGSYQLVISSVALDERNRVLRNCLKRTGITDLETNWASLFRGKAGFAVFSHQQWVQWVSDHDSRGQWVDWLQYVTDRYAL
jgi:hypothetical protein